MRLLSELSTIIGRKTVSLCCSVVLLFVTISVAAGKKHDIASVDAFKENALSAPLIIVLNFNVSNYNSFNVSCNGASDGSATVIPSNGVAPYTFVWSTGAVIDNISGVSAGTYTVTVTDNLGEIISGSVTLNEPAVINPSGVITNVTCFGGSNGAIDLSIAGGVSPFSFLWSNSSLAEDISSLVQSSYSVTVTDANNCQANKSFSVTEPSVVSAVINITNSTCDLANGSATASGNGGTGVNPASYSYEWFQGITSLSNSATLSNVLAGNYSVVVTDPSSCSVTIPVTIGGSPAVTLGSVVLFSPSCNGGNNGSINITVATGSPSYSYLWSSGAGAEDISGLTAGNYTVTVTDVLNCTVTASYSLTDYPTITPSIIPTNISCNGGSNGAINLSVTGGVAPYTYSWTNGAITEDVSGLSAGTYTVTVTDANFCKAGASQALTQPVAIVPSTVVVNVTCNGGSNGSINLSVTGGVSPYTFLWSNASVSEDISGLPGGTYTVTITDANLCTATTSASITQPSLISPSMVAANVVCNGDHSGLINLSVSGGVSPYTFLWNNGSVTEDVNGLLAGSYTVTITDAALCTSVKSANVTEPPVISPSTSVTNVTCNGGSNGSVDLSVSGGVSPYTYNWNTGAVTEDIAARPAGSYTVTITDANLCSKVSGAGISQATAISPSTGISNVTCNGGSNGSINLSVSGGVSPYTYLWSNGANTEDISGRPAGNYTVTITDASLCTTTGSYSISQAIAISPSTSVSNVTCSGVSNGAINLSVSGGTSPYTFLWSNGANTEDLINRSAGTYTVTITDASSCTSTTNASISQPSVINVTSSITNVTCNGGSNGAINITVSGGTAPYSFSWSNSAVTEDVSGLTSGTFTVTVTDGNLCTLTQFFSVTQPSAINLSTSVTNAGCSGAATGAVDLSVSGGVSPYAYIWSTGAITQDISSIPSGNYTVTVTDASLCTATTSAAVGQPSTISVSVLPVNGTCNASNGSATALALGGLPPYGYLWSNGANSILISSLAAATYTVTVTDLLGCTATGSGVVGNAGSPVVTVNSVTNVTCNGLSNGAIDISISGGQPLYLYSWSNLAITQDLNNLSAGTYTVTVTDNNLCSTVKSIQVNQPAVLSIAGNITNVSCNGLGNGAVDASISGGTGPFTYLWSNSALSEDISGLSAGTYTLTVTDVNNCTSSKSFVVTQPAVLSVSMSSTQSTCGVNNGTATAAPAGGTSPYTYLWSTSATTAVINGLNPANYGVTVTDQNGCTIQNAVAVTSANAPVISAAVVANVSCNAGSNGSIDITISGGTGTITYLWNTSAATQDLSGLSAGSYTVTVSDANNCSISAIYSVTQPASVNGTALITNLNCNAVATGAVNLTPSGGTMPYTFLWSNASATEDLSSVLANTYTVTITDANSCTATKTYIVTQPPAMSVNSSIQNVRCNGGSNGNVDLSVFGGTPGFTYAWSNGSTTQDITALTAGTYTVTVTDNNSCKSTTNHVVSQPAALGFNFTNTNTTCSNSNGSTILNVSGGTGSCSFHWSNGATTQQLMNISANTYTVSVSDQNNCTASSSTTITNTPGPIISQVVSTPVTCNGGTNGAVDITVLAGTVPYTYLWNNGATTQDLTGVPASIYNVTVTDLNNCTASTSSTVTQPSAIITNFNVSQQPTCGNANGSVVSNVVGGAGSYTYLWSTGATTAGITNLVAGTYTVTVTDANLCIATSPVTLGGISGPTVTVGSIQNVSCFGTLSGAVDIAVTSGTFPYTYLWSNNATTEDLVAVAAGTYTITVTDANSCNNTLTVSITEPSIINGTFTRTPSFCGQSTGSVQVNPTGGTPPYTYLWNNGATTASISNLPNGPYTVTITDFRGCTRRRSTNVQLANGPVISVVTEQSVTCPGGNDGLIDIDITGGVLPYTYIWSNGSTTQDISGLVADTFSVAVSDDTGCTDSLTFVIEQPSPFSIAATIVNSNCGQATGSISLSTSGATGGYAYLWSTGSTVSSITGLVPTSYTVTVSDSRSCDTVLVYNVGTIAGPALAVDSLRLPKCNGNSNGAIFISVSGGAGPYHYLWNDGAVSKNRQNIAAGVYTVTVTDNNNCTGSVSVTLNQPSPITIGFTVTNATCNQPNGSISAVPGGGTGSTYTYLWSTGSANALIQNLAAATYKLTVTDSLGCTKVDSAKVTTGGLASAQVQSSANPLCNGSANGQITVAVTGGSLPYASLQWSNGDNGVTADSLVAGSYTITITDNAGCTSSNTFSLTDPVKLIVSTTGTNANCGQSNGSAIANVTGGTGTYSYLWSNSNTTQQVTGLIAAGYIVTVTDQNNCTDKDTIDILDIAAPLVSLSALQNVKCKNGTDGSIDIAVSGGAIPYTFLWSNTATTEDITGLAANTYTVTVSDVAGCTVAFFTSITEPDSISLSASITDAACNQSNGAISVTVNGGVSPYTYLWSNGDVTAITTDLVAFTYTLTVTDNNSCLLTSSFTVNNLGGPQVSLLTKANASCPAASDGSISVDVQQGVIPYAYNWSNGAVTSVNSNLPAGIYTLTVTDANNCITLFTDTITEPDPIVIPATITDATCGLSNGIISVSPTGGTPLYSYLWSTGANSSVVSALAANTYTVTVTDSRLCVKDTSFTITNSGVPVISTVLVDSATCNAGANGLIDIDVTGGVIPYTYTWINTPQSTQDADSLTAGGYSVIVTDGQGCTSTQSFQIFEPSAIVIAYPLLQNAACGVSNGSIAISVSGGQPGYSYLWSNGSVNDTLQGIPAGSYTITVTDGKGCTKEGIANISNASGPVILSVDSGNVSCPGGTDGFINITVSGGTAPLTYSWANSANNTTQRSDLPADTYTFTVSDALGCLAIRSVEIRQPAPIVVNPVIPQKNPPYNLKCNQSEDGEIYLSVNGGTAPYGFIWSNGSTTQNILLLAANTYTVVITDQKGCSTTIDYTLTEPPQLVSDAGTDFTVCGETITSLNANTPSYGIGYWTSVNNSGVIAFSDSTSPSSAVTNLQSGDDIFKWTVTDGKCNVSSKVTVNVTSAIEAIPGIDRIICGETANLNATKPQFGTGFWTAFSPGVTIDDSSKAFTGVNNLNIGNNIFRWIVINGTCRDTANINIYRNEPEKCKSRIQIPTGFTPNADGYNDVFLIKGLEDFPDNDLVIYNRWGNAVYESSNYQNNWNGVNTSGDPLPDGTYFIILKVRQLDGGRVFNSYLDLRR